MTLVSQRKKWVSLIVLFALIWAGAAAPARSASAAAATPFSDVPAGHWAEKHIAKLSLQGLLKGDGGLFKPNDALSREQAVVLAIRFMGLEDQVDATDMSVFPESFKVDNYYKPYITFAIKKQLLNSAEEFALANSEPNKPWGSSPATREWMAQLLVRALGLEDEASGKSGTPTSFADDASINKSYLGAINVAVGYGLLKGLDGNKFDPRGSLTRAMAATLFSRAEALVDTSFPGQATGIWLSVGADALTMLHADGSTTTYSVTDGTLFARADSEQLMTADALKPYGKALVISADGVHADYAEQVDDTPQVSTVEGKLVVVNETKHQISLLIGEDVQSYDYDAASPPKASDTENNVVALNGIPTGTDVKLIVDAFTSSPKVLSVALGSSLVSKTGTGTITGVDLVNGSLQFTDDASSASESRPVSSVATILKNGDKATLSDLKAGDVISYEVKDGALSSIVVTQSTAQTSATGYLYKIDKNDQLISYTNALNSSEISAKLYNDNVTVSIPNTTGATLDDLYKGDALSLTLDAEGKVSAIAVTNRSFSTLTGATISSNYDPDSGFLTVKTANGQPGAYSVDENTKFDYNGTPITLTTATSYMTKGKRVDIGYTGTQLVYVSFISQYAGTVVKNDANAHQLQLTLDNGQSVTVAYATPYVEIYGVDTANYSNIGQGDRVVAMLDASQTMASSIYVRKTLQVDIVSVDAAHNKLTVKDSAGTTTEWTLNAGVSVQDANGNATTLGSYAAGSALNAIYEGKTLKSIKYVPVVYGKVTAVDAAAGTVTLQQGANAPIVYNVGTSAAVTKNGSTSSLSALSANDRVELRKSATDSQLLTVIAGTTKQVWYAEPSSWTLNFLKTSTLSNDAVKVSQTAYIHQGDTTLTLGNLANGDKVTVYVARNVAIEIEKQ